MVWDEIKQICSCLVDLIHQRRVHVAMGEKAVAAAPAGQGN